jgi:hypothetical protein
MRYCACSVRLPSRFCSLSAKTAEWLGEEFQDRGRQALLVRERSSFGLLGAFEDHPYVTPAQDGWGCTAK